MSPVVASWQKLLCSRLSRYRLPLCVPDCPPPDSAEKCCVPVHTPPARQKCCVPATHPPPTVTQFPRQPRSPPRDAMSPTARPLLDCTLPPPPADVAKKCCVPVCTPVPNVLFRIAMSPVVASSQKLLCPRLSFCVPDCPPGLGTRPPKMLCPRQPAMLCPRRPCPRRPQTLCPHCPR